MIQYKKKRHTFLLQKCMFKNILIKSTVVTHINMVCKTKACVLVVTVSLT